MGQCVSCKASGPKKYRGKLAEPVMEDLLKNSSFSRQEILDWHAAFTQAVPAGMMTYEAYQRLVLALVFRRGPEKFESCGAQLMHHLDLSFRQYDIDGDHRITFREFLLGMSISTKGTFEEKIAWAFSLYDIDKDGTISPEEMQEILELTNKAYGQAKKKEETEKLVKFIFSYLDSDHNGAISVKEFICGLKAKPELFEFFTGGSDILSTVEREDLHKIKLGTHIHIGA